MVDFFSNLFDTSDFPARWHCGTWTAGHGWLHVLSDLGVWSAYLAIPCVLIYFVARKQNLPFRSIFILFGAFIFFCGATHLMEAIIFWWPAYRLAGLIKLGTALVSWATVMALIPIMPKALALRGPQELERVVEERTAQLKLANEELALTQKRKDDFLAMLAHELRNPLAPIRGAIDLMKINRVDRETNDWAIGMMDQQVHQITRLVDDLLDVSRITRGKVELRKKPVELTAVVERAVETARPVIDAHQHELSIQLPSHPVWLDADLVRMAQVLSNVLNNAAKYTDRGGCISLIAEQQGSQVVIRIRDTGIGIDGQLLPHIFDLFTQADRAIDRSQGGLGIGLTLVRNLVNMHGGEVSAASDGLGQGSEFTIRLPALECPLPTTDPTWKPRVMTARRVLVVDDNVGAATIMQAMLAKLWQHEVRVAHDGLQAIDLAGSFRPEVILLDIGLPGLDGYAVARRIRSVPEHADTLLIAITGYGQAEDRRTAFDAGFDEHAIKPVTAAMLEQMLTQRRV